MDTQTSLLATNTEKGGGGGGGDGGVGEISGRMEKTCIDDIKNKRGDVEETGGDEGGDQPGEVEEEEKGRCCSCQLKIDSTRPGCEASGRVYHQACFKCSTCLQVIQDRYFVREEQPVCANCYKVEGVHCGVCKEIVEGDCLTSNGATFHAKCMKCSECGNVLKGRYFSYKDKLICEADYQKTEINCHDCGETIQGPYYTVNSQKVVCEKDYKKNIGSCGKCGGAVDGKILRVSDKLVFHPDCFTCQVCQISLLESGFNLDSRTGGLYCSEDYNKKVAVSCYTCRKPIVPKKGEKTVERLTALDKSFHTDCFRCEDCKVLLDNTTGSECFPVENKPFCHHCSNKRKS